MALGHRAAHEDIRDVDLGAVAVMPGLVNAHTHLELSYLRDEVAPASAFVWWIRGLLAARRRHPDARAPEILDAIDRAVAEAIACGTAVVGDVSNTLASFSPLASSPLAAVVFYEIVKFNALDPEDIVERARRELDELVPTDLVRTSLAAHAPYSVAPLLFRAIRKDIDRDPFAPCSVHLAESAEEVEFIRTAGGPWRTVRGIRPGRRRRSVRCSTSTKGDFSTHACSRCTSCRLRQRTWRGWRRAARRW